METKQNLTESLLYNIS